MSHSCWQVFGDDHSNDNRSDIQSSETRRLESMTWFFSVLTNIFDEIKLIENNMFMYASIHSCDEKNWLTQPVYLPDRY